MLAVLESLAEKGIAPPARRANDLDAAAQAARDLGYPVWVHAGQGFRMRVDHGADLPLACAKARKRHPTGPVLIQRAVQGDAYRVIGFKTRRDFRPVEILSETPLDSPYWAPMTYAVPAGLTGEAYAKVAAAAKKAGLALLDGGYYAEIEVLLTEHGPLVIEIHTPPGPNPVLTTLMRLAQGIDLDAAAKRAAQFEAPFVTPTRDMAAAVCWIPSRSGIVTEIQGVAAARALPGVQEILLNVRPGDILGHILDVESRDRIGWVITLGPTRELALRNAFAARDAIRVITRHTLD